VQYLNDKDAGPECEVYFGGPDLQPGRLRNLLAECIAAVPPGGSIDWVTYYFRDRKLAETLLSAHRRGVKVTLTLEGQPRTVSANKTVAAMLSGREGLGSGFRSISLPGLLTRYGKGWKPHIHEKLYCFSHPKPVAFIGSFNPSGDDPEDHPEVIEEIGDQDRGHNVLVGLDDPLLVEALVAHARWIHRTHGILFYRFSKSANRAVRGKDTEIHFWPRVRPHPMVQFLSRLGANARIRIAGSHIKGTSVVKDIIGLSSRGAAVEVLAEPTLRRVPAEEELMLTQAGILFRRVTHPDGFPMHNKFVLAENAGQRWVIFGSFNWTERSFRLNHEIGAISTNEHLWEEFVRRWEVLAGQ
jgi:phosphatidylserine/phosphatidylglycerophosphate/cardiolipin synthase-like enzyme